MSNKGGRVSPDYLADIAPEYAIYNTRNRIVHAKSNWKGSDAACFEPDMADMNEFMKALAQCLIVWNGRQPEEFRI